MSYTTPAAPTAVPSTTSPENDTGSATNTTTDLGQKTALNVLREESESGSPRPDADPPIIAPIPKAAPPQFLNGNHDFEGSRPSGDGVMKAALADVQEAIEQLGRKHGDNDGGRSFSFVSTRDDRDTDTDIDLSDLDGTDHGDDVEGWHRGARMKLAEKARRAVEEAEKLEAMMGGLNANSDHRVVAPPIEVELSDESEDEVERDEGFTSRSTAIQGIPEEDEDVETDAEVPSSREKGTAATATPAASITPPSNEDTAVSLTLPEKDETQAETATATRSSFQISRSPANPAVDSSSIQGSEPRSSTNRSSTSLPAGAQTNPDNNVKTESPVPISMPVPEHTRSSTPLRESTPSRPLSPPASSPRRPMSPPVSQSKHTSVASASSLRGSAQASIPAASPEPTSALPPAPGAPSPPVFSVQQANSIATGSTVRNAASPPPITTSPAPAMPTPVSLPAAEEKKKKPHPSEWTLEDVVDWLKSKGFDQDVCDKFIGTSFTPPSFCE